MLRFSTEPILREALNIISRFLLSGGKMAESDKSKDVNITYDTLFELLRREKGREELQQLPESFCEDVVNYLREKDLILKKQDDENIFSAEEKEKTKSQLENVKKIIKELYDRRERKIMEMALFKSRTNSNLINTTNLLKEERVMFESLLSELNRSRNGVLLNILNMNEPVLNERPAASEISKPEIKSVVNENETQKANGSIENPKIELNNISIRFTNYVPKFVGKELEIYGPFEPEDVANLPRQIAEILIKKGRAEEIKNN